MPDLPTITTGPAQDGIAKPDGSHTPVPESIMARTARGAGWVVGWRMTRRLLGLANTLILVRLLVPADFGLIALGVSFSGMVEQFSAIGVEDALIRDGRADRDLYDTGFTMNALRGLAIAAVLAVAAGPLADAFHDARLTSVILVLAACSLVTSLTNIGVVEFRRDIAFHKEFALLIVPRVCAIAVTIGMALSLRSYWALLGGVTTARVMGLIMSYTMHPYRPRFALRAWRRLAGFSAWSWALMAVQVVRDQSVIFLVGRTLGDTMVGIYSIGAEVASLPTTEVVGPFTRACFSGFSAARHSGEAPSGSYLRVVGAVALLTLPAGLGISALAGPLTHLLLGAKWTSAIWVIALLGPFCGTTVFGLISETLLSAYGMLGTMFKISAFFAFTRTAFLVLMLLEAGFRGAIIAIGLGIMVEHFSYVALTVRRFRIPLRDLLAVIWRSFLGCAAMAAVLIGTGLGWGAASGGPVALAARVALGVVVGGLAYGATVLIGWRVAGCPPGAERDVLGILQVRQRLRWLWKLAFGLLPGSRPSTL